MGRDQQILEAAAELFYERGFHAVGVDEIGARAGVTGPAIYRHFSGKDEILATLFNEALDQLLVRTEAAEGEPWAELELLIRAQTTFALNHRHVISIYTREGRALAEPWRKSLGRRTRKHVDIWVDLLGRCHPGAGEDELRSSAFAAIGLIHSVAHWPPEALRTPDLVDFVAGLVTGGLRALGSAVASGPAASGTGLPA